MRERNTLPHLRHEARRKMFGSGTTFTCPWPKLLQLLLSLCFQWLPSPFSAGRSAPSLCGSELVIWMHLLRASPIEPHASSHDLNCRISSSPACSPLMALAPCAGPTPLRRCSTMAGVESCMSTGATDLQKPDTLPSFDLNMLGSSSTRPRAWARSSLMRFCIAPTSVVALAPACADMAQTDCQATVSVSHISPSPSPVYFLSLTPSISPRCCTARSRPRRVLAAGSDGDHHRFRRPPGGKGFVAGSSYHPSLRPPPLSSFQPSHHPHNFVV